MFFFFQAEDGIRDVAVTGVQTCALPIFDECTRQSVLDGDAAEAHAVVRADAALGGEPHHAPLILNHAPHRRSCKAEIGRASCRERVYISLVGVGGTSTAGVIHGAEKLEG